MLLPLGPKVLHVHVLGISRQILIFASLTLGIEMVYGDTRLFDKCATKNQTNEVAIAADILCHQFIENWQRLPFAAIRMST